MKEETVTTRDETIRQLIDWTILCGRKRLSPQTGYVHYFYHSDPDDVQQAIPVVENALYALALFRSRLSENVLEAKSLIERLFSFQCAEGDSTGNFPIYLHEYPQCKDRFLGSNLLPPLYWIFKKFQLVLGAQLTARMEKGILSLLKHTLKAYQQKAPSYCLAIKIAAVAKAFGSLIKDEEIEKEGEQLLSSLRNERSHWHSSSNLGEIAVALQMLYPSIANSPWRDFWDYLSQTWHRQSCCYAGPAIKEFQLEEEPQPTLYDLFMGYLSKTFPNRILKDHPIHFQAALIQQTEDILPQLELPLVVSGTIGNASWKLVHAEKYAFTLVEKPDSLNPALENGFYPFRLVWGSPKRTHTFGCQGGNIARMDFEAKLGRIDIHFFLGELIQVEDREKARELAFYVDLQDQASISLEGDMATTFKIGENVTVEMDNLSIILQFAIEEGSGHFLGHIMRGNRPAQIALKGKNRFNAYDWQLFLRTLRRTSPCKIKAAISINHA